MPNVSEISRVKVQPIMLRWARERACLSYDTLTHRFPRLNDWESGERDPTFKQLEAYAKATYAPFGYFFLQAPPEEPLPIPDFRTIGGVEVKRPSPNLLDTIYNCQQRQTWYRDYEAGSGGEPLRFIGSATIDSDVVEVAGAMRKVLGFDLEERRVCATWTESLRKFIAQADAAGVLVMCSGVVLNNNRRHLDTEEFRGFALSDDLAPLIFINGSDTKAAQMFTLAHELAHLWLGRSALSNATVAPQWSNAIEGWCNRVAAELLAPIDVVKQELRPGEPLSEVTSRLARRFKVSTLVVLRRLLDADYFGYAEFQQAYDAEVAHLQAIVRPSGGGDFYLTTAARVSKRFARAIYASTLEGHTLYQDAFQLLGISKSNTFNELGRSLGYNT